MEMDENSNNKNELSQIDKGVNWRKKMIIDVLGDDYLEHNLPGGQSDQHTDESLVSRLLEENVDRGDVDDKAGKSFIEHDDLEKKLEEYYADQKESDIKAFEYYQEGYSNEEIWEWLKYRWEFMRRSPDYMAAFEQEQSNCENETPSFNLFKRYEFWKSFGLLCAELPNPNLSFDELQDRKKNDIAQEPFFRLHFITKNYRTDAEISYFTYLDEELVVDEFNKIQFIIDFTKLKSITDTKRIVSRLIDDHWNNYHRSTGQRAKSDPMDIYDRILKVGDLRDKVGLSYRKIAEKVFKSAKNDRSAKRKVAGYYSRYKEMIEGGYRKI